MNATTRNLATHFRAKGLEDGGAVAVWLPNSVEWVIACLATIRARGVAVPISFDATQSEVGYRLDDAQCSIVVTRSERDRDLSEIIFGRSESDNPHTERRQGGWRSWRPDEFHSLCASPAQGVELAPDDLDVCSSIFYTSGTTGQPKGVMVSSRRLLWSTAACWAPILNIDENDRILTPLPMFHIFSQTVAILTPLATGASAMSWIVFRFVVQLTF